MFNLVSWTPDLSQNILTLAWLSCMLACVACMSGKDCVCYEQPVRTQENFVACGTCRRNGKHHSMGFKLACFMQGSTIQISIHKVQGLNGPYIQLTLNNSLEIITGIMPSWVTLDMICDQQAYYWC